MEADNVVGKQWKEWNRNEQKYKWNAPPSCFCFGLSAIWPIRRNCRPLLLIGFGALLLICLGALWSWLVLALSGLDWLWRHVLLIDLGALGSWFVRRPLLLICVGALCSWIVCLTPSALDLHLICFGALCSWFVWRPLLLICVSGFNYWLDSYRFQ